MTRILTMIHTRWSRSLGGPRTQFELTNEWHKLGCSCTKYSVEDAFPNGVIPPGVRFADRAADFVRANQGQFDIIDCHQTDLPFSKDELHFDGLLVARSVGLMPLYTEVLAAQDRRDLWSVWGPRLAAGWVRRLPSRAARRKAVADIHRAVEESFRVADLINVANGDDVAYIAERYGLGSKCVVVPFGLVDDTAAALADAARPAQARHAARTVAFVGNWEPRKGSRDWWRIVRRVRRRVPDARFVFVGTSADRGAVVRALGTGDVPWVTVVPRYENGELPALLSDVTVSAFPSYIEGFGFGVLETLAAGLPTVAYNCPGPRVMAPPATLTPVGDPIALADALVAHLTAPLAKYEAAAAAARVGVDHLRWPAIARATLAIYQTKLTEVRAAQ